MRLIGMPISPFVRKVRVSLIEKGIIFSLEKSSAWDDNSIISKLNPLGKMPVLITSDEQAVYDSKVIIQYLETLATGDPLIPAGDIGAIEVKRIEALSDGMCEAAIAIFLEKKRLPEKQDTIWIRRQQEKVNRVLFALNELILGKEWFYGDGLSIADISVATALGWYKIRFPEARWQNDFPALSTHVSRLFERKSFVSTKP